MLFFLLAVSLDPAAANRFAHLALDCVTREYPNQIQHVLNSDEDARPPRALTPAFYGCYDWHSAVHGHWLLARLARAFPNEPFAASAREALARHLTRENLAREAEYVSGAGRASFERPYGLAWLLELALELREWDTEESRQWRRNLEPLENAAVARLSAWLPKLSHPVRTGVHSQTAFSLGLMHDYAAENPRFRTLVAGRIRDFYLRDRDCPIAYEPSGEDFLSPCLSEADVVRRVLPPGEFATWLTRFLPKLDFKPAVVTDPTDGRLAHLDGLNLSRAWMLEGIAAALPAADPRIRRFLAIAEEHKQAGLKSVTGEHYAGGHWLGTFAVYLTTKRGLPARSR